MANTYPTQDDDGQWYTLISVLDGDMAIDAGGDAYLAWIDNHEAWQASTSLRLRTTGVASTTTASQVTKHYYANGQRIATRVEDDLYYVLGDHLGSTSLVTDDQGNEACPECSRRIGHVIYDALRLRSGQALRDCRHQHPAGHPHRPAIHRQVFDASTGLYYYNARYYDPFAGQFTQSDSLVADPLDPAAWNRFSYVNGNPTSLTDPSGHCPICVPLLFIASGALIGELAYAGHLYHTGEQANAADLATWMAWGGIAGAGVGALAYGGAVIGTATMADLFAAGFSTGVANTILTGLRQGGYESLPEIGDAFLQGFYSGYFVTGTASGVISWLGLTNRLKKAIATGVVGASFETIADPQMALEGRWEEIGLHFAAYSVYGYLSPVIAKAGTNLGYKMVGVPPPTPGRMFVPGSGPYIEETVARLAGEYGISGLALAGLDPLLLEFYAQKAQQGWQWFITH